jgi:hypothetical protein
MPPSLVDDHAPTLDETYLTHGAQSPFLPGTNIMYAWDSTCLGLIKTCPRLYEYTIIHGYTTALESIHLRFGAEFHSSLEHFDHLLASGADRETAIHAMVRETLVRTADWTPDLDSKAGRYKNRTTLVQLLIDYVDHFDPDPAETYIKSDGKPAVELSFRHELDWGPELDRQAFEDAGAQPQPYLLCGHLDRVANFNGSLFVLDRKTTTTTLSAYYFAQYDPNNQMTLYTIAGKIMLATPISGVIIDAAQIKLEEPNTFARGFTYRTEDQLQEWLHDLHTTLNLAEIYATNAYWPMNDTSCDKFGGCRFRSICSKSPSVRERFLKADFIQLPEDKRWNPLRSR